MEKGPDAFRTISEVADDLDLPQHVLRFWETRFAQIKPLKRGGGRRYYRPDDVDLLRGIRHLLYGEGYTIRGVQQILREQGARHVQSIGRAVDGEERRSEPAFADTERPTEARTRPSASQPGESGAGILDIISSLRSSRGSIPELPRVVEVPIPPHPDRGSRVRGEDDDPSYPFRKSSDAVHGSGHSTHPPLRSSRDDDALSVGHRAEAGPRADQGTGEAARLSPEAIRLLKATLYELGECRRMLDDLRNEDT